jgi:hypothetical protein
MELCGGAVRRDRRCFSLLVVDQHGREGGGSMAEKEAGDMDSLCSQWASMADKWLEHCREREAGAWMHRRPRSTLN